MEPVWEQTVDDGAFTCRVVQDEDNAYRGTLTVVHTATQEQLLSEQVGVSYGAPFGPDAFDVAEWQDRCIAVIDPWIEAHS